VKAVPTLDSPPMTDYRVGVAVSFKSECRVAWIEANRVDLRPTRVGRADDDVVRVVLSVRARTEPDAIEQVMAVFDKAARSTADGILPSHVGVIGAQAWRAGDVAPDDYR
jgi:hypothetical protein